MGPGERLARRRAYAAETLVSAKGGERRENLHQRTGVLPRLDEAVWQAFATFAGYAYDATTSPRSCRLPVLVIPVRQARAERSGHN